MPRPAGERCRFLHKARPPRPSEPILIPKLRIQFADFPYLHYSIDQRLLTSETCCGYGYEPVRDRRDPPLGFQGSPGRLRMPQEVRHSLPFKPNPILPAKGFQGLGGLCRKDNSSRGSRRLPQVGSRCRDRYEGPTTVPLPGCGMRTAFPFGYLTDQSSRTISARHTSRHLQSVCIRSSSLIRASPTP